RHHPAQAPHETRKISRLQCTKATVACRLWLPRATIAPMPTTETPIRRQYLDIKRRFPHAIVFFRLGDFYETFDDDAVLVAKELKITLTSKPMGKDLRVPLAGFPYHSLQIHLRKLVARGFKVAVCEQMEDP